MTDAEKIYKKRLQEVNQMMKAISEKLNSKIDSINWGHVSNVNYTYQNLLEIKDFLNVK